MSRRFPGLSPLAVRKVIADRAELGRLDGVERIVNENNKKVHFLADAHTTLCGMGDEGVPGFAKPRWTRTAAEVDCKLCLKRVVHS